MMMNLFSIFDPSTSMIFSLNWLSTLILLNLMPIFFWIPLTRLNWIWIKIFSSMFNEFKMILFTKSNMINSLLYITFFTSILINNFFGLFSYIFTSSSHLIFSMSLSLPLWMSLMIYGWINNMNFMFTHLVPQGTPFPLINFMVLIESISNIIRPITLSVRLSANMIAGHLILTLLSGSHSLMSLKFLLMFLILVQSILLILEMSVSMIQSYVFVILSTLYSKETN
uniref:ATP synthase subunit a n=1 Tax=Aulacus sinensis TaxID=2491146 RepID=A0A3S8V0D9_9HYME|nr:ATP synthase F0 subunit 6 [Aulacus sinensis]